ncbi:MAG: glycosyltransferase family 2 protein [Acidobacteriota bacterium]
MSLVSIVVAAYNEEANVARIYQEIRGVLERDKQNWEVIFVDDGSTDGTAGMVRSIRAQDQRVRLVKLARNFGNQAAFLAGLHAARGDAVITMDCDLQHPPSEIPRMLAAWRQGSSAVEMVRRRNPDAGLLERLTSKIFHLLLRKLTDLPLVEGAGDFRLMDRKIVDLMLRFGEPRPFYRGMLPWIGVPAAYLEYDAGPRAAGRSSIRFRRRLLLSLDAVTALSIKPLRAAFFLGFCALAVFLAYSVVVLVERMMGRSVPGYPTIILAMVLLAAVQLISIGALGEYIGRIHEQSRRLPPFIVFEKDE